MDQKRKATTILTFDKVKKTRRQRQEILDSDEQHRITLLVEDDGKEYDVMYEFQGKDGKRRSIYTEVTREERKG